MHVKIQETLDRAALKEYFLSGFKGKDDLKIGVEWEKIGIYRDSGQAIAYSGDRGVAAIFSALVEKHGWEPVFSGSHITALKKGESSITLEPGGQIELSGRKAERLADNAGELFSHLSEIRRISETMDIVWLGTGLQPFSALDEIEWVPKERYHIMRESLKNSGAQTHSMMKKTASVQISLDYTDEADAIEKLRLAMALSPFLTAIFANSPLSEGRLNGFYSARAHIWSETAPERTGILWKVFDSDFTLDDYLEHALDVPALFIQRGERWLPARGLRFREFLKDGFQGHRPRMEDWELHLTTLFTEARLKKYLEIRSLDCQRVPMGLAAPAFLKGLFYDAGSREAAWRTLKDLSVEERKALMRDVPRKGLRTPLRGKDVLAVARELVFLAESGLSRLERSGAASTGEAAYLEPLKESILQKGVCPAEALIASWREDASKEEKIRTVISLCAL